MPRWVPIWPCRALLHKSFWGTLPAASCANCSHLGARVLRTTDQLFAGIADTQTPQGVAALVRPKSATIEDLLRGTPLIIVLAGVQDPRKCWNVLILRALRRKAIRCDRCRRACSGGALGHCRIRFAPKALRASARIDPAPADSLRGILLGSLCSHSCARCAGVNVYAAVAAAQISLRGTYAALPATMGKSIGNLRLPC